MADQKTIEYLQQRFRDYYSNNFVDSVPGIEKREFGFGVFGQKISQRHLAFRSNEEFNGFLRTEAPFFVSYSMAYYSFPDRKPMEAKLFNGSDLIYEFDSKDVPTDCKLKHDSWNCLECSEKGKGIVENCSRCGGRVKTVEWVCEKCLEETKKQTLKLIELLQNDLGLVNDVCINFSGNRGYHVHVRAKEIVSLSQKARVELFDYLSCFNFSFQQTGFVFEGNSLLVPKARLGWNSRLLNSLKSFLENCSIEEFASITSSSQKKSENFLGDRKKIFAEIENGRLNLGSLAKPEEQFSRLLEYLLEKNKLGLDRQTSIDASKIIRVPDSLHGSTGLKASIVSMNKLEKFEPLRETVVFSNREVKVKTLLVPRIVLKDEIIGPFQENEIVSLPEFAAVFLLAREQAILCEV